MRSVLVLLLALLATGCRSLSPFDQALHEVRRTYPEARSTLVTQFDLGWMTRGLALTALSHGRRHDEDVQTLRRVLRTVRTAQVRRYALGGLDSATFAARRFRFDAPGWEAIARVRSGGDRVWVMGQPSTRRRAGTVLVGMLSPEELILVKVTGRYEQLVETLGRDLDARRTPDESP